MLGKLWSAAKWTSTTGAGIATVGSLFFFPYVGLSTYRKSLANPDASDFDLAFAFHEALFTDPKNILTLTPDNLISNSEVQTGLSGWWEAIKGGFKGFELLWDIGKRQIWDRTTPFFTDNLFPAISKGFGAMFSDSTDSFAPTARNDFTSLASKNYKIIDPSDISKPGSFARDIVGPEAETAAETVSSTVTGWIDSGLVDTALPSLASSISTSPMSGLAGSKITGSLATVADTVFFPGAGTATVAVLTPVFASSALTPANDPIFNTPELAAA
ncbi:MAG: hypothetical protein KDJ75_07995 [Alphaproteobacteria bacterium]|nr:hypothetical protein [Alphaproteobacteria bacterium]